MIVAQRKRKCHLCGGVIKAGERFIHMKAASAGSAEGNMCINCVLALSKTFFTKERLAKIVEGKL